MHGYVIWRNESLKEAGFDPNVARGLTGAPGEDPHFNWQLFATFEGEAAPGAR
jgi:hypothetical protein